MPHFVLCAVIWPNQELYGPEDMAEHDAQKRFIMFSAHSPPLFLEEGVLRDLLEDIFLCAYLIRIKNGLAHLMVFTQLDCAVSSL